MEQVALKPSMKPPSAKVTMEQVEIKQSRIVPSGKVYRQKFDAEVQLVRALEKGSAKSRGSKTNHDNDDGDDEDQLLITAPVLPEGSIPLIHDARSELSGGILNDRQKTWAGAFPNDPYTENPVVYKFVSKEVRDHLKEPESRIASKEVSGLPDVLVPAKIGSDIIDRISESRKHRHDTTVEDMHQELGLISANMEPRVQEASDDLLNQLHESEMAINEIFSKIEKDEELILFTFQELETLWQKIEIISKDRQNMIISLDSKLTLLEDERMDSIKQLFKTYTKQLEKIAHLMAPDLYKMLNKESQLINQCVLSNRRAYADLYCRLMLSDIDKEKKLHTQWKRRVEDWKKLHIEIALKNFNEFLKSEEMTEPSEINEIHMNMQEHQLNLNDKRITLIDTLRDMKPPTSTKTAVYKWNEQITEISKQIDEWNQEYFAELCKEYENVCQKALDRVEALKVDLIGRRVCNHEQAQEVVTETCLPQVGDLQSSFEQAMETMDHDFETHNAHIMLQLRSLFKFSQGAAHVWDGHELGLAKQERALQEKLDECRQNHDNENQDKEANLDIIMDKMRQDATEEDLKASLDKALEMLGHIRESYEEFHQMETQIVQEYPGMVNEEVNRYDKAVCKFYSVDRNDPKDSQEVLGIGQDSDASTEKKEEDKEDESKSKSKMKKKQKTKLQLSPDDPKDALPLAVSEVLSTANGTTFYVLTIAGKHGIPEDSDSKEQMDSERSQQLESKESFKGLKGKKSPIKGRKGAAAEEIKEEDEEDDADAEEEEIEPAEMISEEASPRSEDMEIPFYIKNVDISDEMILDIKKCIRMNYLNQLEMWNAESQNRAMSVVIAKTEELNSELDLRMHLHQPRPRRTELDVHNVRAAELVMHRERVSRHVKGVTEELNQLKDKFNSMTDEHNDLVDGFKESIEQLEHIFISATKSSRLVSLTNQVTILQEKHMKTVRTSLRKFRQLLDDTVQMLRESNARFIKSFKLFSDGGNFNPEEIKEYRKDLDKMNQKVDLAEGLILTDLEGMESKRLEQATKISTEFEDRFKHHMIDLLFMEKIARWLTNTQVRIKSSVAESNTQAQNLSKALRDLEKRIDAVEKPNPDKEQITPTELYGTLKGLFLDFKNRSIFLNSLKDPKSMTSSKGPPMQGNPAVGSRVAFTSDSLPPASKPGKQPGEDPSVHIIKTILTTQQSRIPNENGWEQTEQVENAEKSPTTPAENAVRDSKSRTSKQSSDNSKKGKREKQSDSADKTREGTPKDSGNSNIKMQQRMNDKKFIVFGESAADDDLTHFIGKIKHILREALEGLLQAAEMYYRQKGSRPVTRPQALQENFEPCADILLQKLQSYFEQADEYHNRCLQEFRCQLIKLEDNIGRVPVCVIKELLQKNIHKMNMERAKQDVTFELQLRLWDNARMDHKRTLRPALGHPQQAGELETLNKREEDRHKAVLQGVEENTKLLQEMTLKNGTEFIESLAKTAEQILLDLDDMITVDDVINAKMPPTKYPTSELIRRHNAGVPLEDPEEGPRMKRGKGSWEGFPKKELVIPAHMIPKPPSSPTRSSSSISEVPRSAKSSSSSRAHSSRSKSRQSSKSLSSKSVLTASVNTAQTNQGHHLTIEIRTDVYKEYKQQFDAMIMSIEEQRQRQITSEKRWMESWIESIDKVKQLFVKGHSA